MALWAQLTAQPVMHAINPDSLTWQQYQQGRWDELLRTGRQLNRQGIDYYFLRMRMAIAAIETANYDLAVKHLQKALYFNPRDLHATRYLVLARQYSLMPAEAGALFTRLPDNQRQGLQLNHGFALLSAHMDAGHTFTDHKASEDFGTLAGDAGLYGSESGLSSSGMADAGLWVQLRPGWLLYGGIQSFTHNFGQNYAYPTPELKLDRVELNGTYKDYYYRIDSPATVFTARASVKQNSAYVQLRHAPAHNILLVASAGISKIEGEFPYSKATTIRFTDTARLDLNTGTATLFSLEVPAAGIDYALWHTTDYRFALGGMIHFNKISPGAGLHVGRMNDTSLIQLQLGYTLRPSGNAATWQQTEVFLLEKQGNRHAAVKIAAGHWLGTKTHVYATVLAGRLNGMADQWGFITFNHREQCNFFGEAAVVQQLTPKLGISIRYRHGKSYYLKERMDDKQQIEIAGNRLTSHGFIGGLIWNF